MPPAARTTLDTTVCPVWFPPHVGGTLSSPNTDLFERTLSAPVQSVIGRLFGRKKKGEEPQQQPGALRPIESHPAVVNVARDGDGTIVITLARGHHVGDLLALCASRGSIVSVRTEEPTLHDMYIQVVGGAVPLSATEAA